VSAYDDGLGSFAPCPDCHERDGRHLAGCPSDDSDGSFDEDVPVSPARRAAERADFQRAWHLADSTLHTPEPKDHAGKLARALELAVEAHTCRVQAMVDGSPTEQAGWARELVQRVQDYHTLLATAPDEVRRAHRHTLLTETERMTA
jgi:hypothetical protein